MIMNMSKLWIVSANTFPYSRCHCNVTSYSNLAIKTRRLRGVWIFKAVIRPHCTKVIPICVYMQNGHGSIDGFVNWDALLVATDASRTLELLALCIIRLHDWSPPNTRLHRPSSMALSTKPSIDWCIHMMRTHGWHRVDVRTNRYRTDRKVDSSPSWSQCYHSLDHKGRFLPILDTFCEDLCSQSKVHLHNLCHFLVLRKSLR